MGSMEEQGGVGGRVPWQVGVNARAAPVGAGRRAGVERQGKAGRRGAQPESRGERSAGRQPRQGASTRRATRG